MVLRAADCTFSGGVLALAALTRRGVLSIVPVMTDTRAVSTRSLVLGPAVVTLAVTLLRLTGELLHWSPSLFSAAPGGGGALVGISWLPPVFGILFAIQLVRAGQGPVSGGRAIVRAVLGLVATAVVIAGCSALGLIKESGFSLVALFLLTAAIAIGAAIAWSGWPALGRTLLAYAFAARVPVALLMLVAMIGNWGTHYDAAPPGMPEMSVFFRWFMTGAVPQLTTWIAITVLTGALAGSIAGAVASRGPASAARPAVV